MKKPIIKQITPPRRALAFLIAGALMVSGVAVVSQLQGARADPVSGDPLDSPSYGLLSAVSFVDAGMNYLSGIALDGAGKVWTWGWNQHGQLGINKGYSITSPDTNLLGYAGGMIRVPYFVDNGIFVVQVSAGYHYNLALDDEGNVYSWGHNNNQQTGFTTNTTYPSGVGRIEPAKVPGLPRIVRIAANNGYLDNNISIALDENGDLWVWGSNGSGEHGQGNTTITSAYRATPHKVVFPEPITIVDFCAGGWLGAYGAFVNVLDSNGDRWTWGGNQADESTYMLGLSVTTTRFTTPVKATPAPGMGKLIRISSSYKATLALDENGKIWQWGRIYGTGSSASSATNYNTPVQVAIDPAEIAAVGYTPIPQDIAAGESTYYFIDQHGRPWAWGSGRYYGFGREGGYNQANDQVSSVALQYPKVLGDGDTQINDSSVKAPPAKAPNSRGNYGFDNLHPTVYDEKYQNNATDSVWIDLAFKPIPKLSKIFAARSTYMLLDEDGNLYRWGLDGSGSIAWGWDYDSKYDTTGNAKNGLYDKYLYEVMYMRGAPRIDPLTLSFDKPTTKIYKGVTLPGTDSVKVNLTVPSSVDSPQMNISFSCTVQAFRYVVIPADPSNPDFQNASPSRADFDDAFLDVSYQSGDLLTGGPITSQSAAMTLTETITISDNCKIWVLVNDIAYTKETDTVQVYTADNFYTPLELFHRGVKKADPLDVLYDTERDRVEKVYPTAFDLARFGMDETQYSDLESTVYGIPLYDDGTVIPDAYFGYDQVRITALDVPAFVVSPTMDPDNIPQPNPVTFTLDGDYAALRPNFNERDFGGELTLQAVEENTHTFFYVLELPQKNAFINGKPKPDNGLPGMPVELKSGDTIKYTIDLMNKAGVGATPPNGSTLVTDVLPIGLSAPTNITYGGTYNPATRKISWDLSVYPEIETTLSFETTVVTPGNYDNTASLVYDVGDEEDTNTTYHKMIPPHDVTEEFRIYDSTPPYNTGAKLHVDNVSSVNDGFPFYRGVNPPPTIETGGVHYTYYGVSIDGALPDTRPLTGLGALPTVLIPSVEGAQLITYLYKRTTWTVTEHFQEYASSEQLQGDVYVGVEDNLPYSRATGTPPLSIVKDSKTFTYYGYQIDGVFQEGDPPANPINPVKDNRFITYFYRTTYEITEQFKTAPTEPGNPDLTPPMTNGVVSPATPPTIWSGDSFFPINPPETLPYDGFYWEYNGYTLDGDEYGGVPVGFPSVSGDHLIVYLYEKGDPITHTLHLRQVILNRNDQTALPYTGYFSLENNGGNFNVTTDSNKEGVEVAFRDIIVTFVGASKIYAIHDILPQNYIYDGYLATSSYLSGTHNPALRSKSSAQADFSGVSDLWVTVFITSVSNPGKHDWGLKINDFGIIE